MYKPNDYPDASPYFLVDGVERVLTFLETAWGAERLRTFADDEGRYLHAEIRVGDSVIMLGDATPEWPPCPGMVHLYVPDARDHYRRALAAGATSVQEPTQKGDGDERGGVRGPGGVTWWIATQRDA